VILYEPFILNVGAPTADWEGWKAKITGYQETTNRLAKPLGAVFVPLQQRFNDACNEAEVAYWLWDGVHPSPPGTN
jgi:lysophospholipase L1-like esterase